MCASTVYINYTVRLISIPPSAKDVARKPEALDHRIAARDEWSGQAGAPSRVTATGVLTPTTTDIFRYKI